MSEDKLQPIDPIVTFSFKGVKYESKVLNLQVQSQIEQATNQGYMELMGRCFDAKIPGSNLKIDEIVAILQIAFDGLDLVVIHDYLITDRIDANNTTMSVILKPFEGMPKSDEKDESKKK